MQAQGFELGNGRLPALMLYYAKNGLFDDARALWGELVSSSYKPGIEIVSTLIHAYAEIGEFDEIVNVVHESISRGFVSEPEMYSSAVSCFGAAGQLRMMEDMVKSLVSRGFRVDSLVGNAFVKYHAMFGSLDEMEEAYQRAKRSRILIEEEAIRAMARAYISGKKFYKLGEFLRDLGLGRRNTGNLLWNLLLLSYAANFKMKSLQREFLSMLEAGFRPDLTTFNVRALAFSRMCMFWDLHLSIVHMKHERVVPDLVTYGCIVDLYLERRLGRNLSFALDVLDVGMPPVVETDEVVFDVFGKGDFHSSSEVLLESTRGREWTYSKLVRMYLKKQHRRNQIFWNY